MQWPRETNLGQLKKTDMVDTVSMDENHSRITCAQVNAAKRPTKTTQKGQPLHQKAGGRKCRGLETHEVPRGREREGDKPGPQHHSPPPPHNLRTGMDSGGEKVAQPMPNQNIG